MLRYRNQQDGNHQSGQAERRRSDTKLSPRQFSAGACGSHDGRSVGFPPIVLEQASARQLEPLQLSIAHELSGLGSTRVVRFVPPHGAHR